MAVAAAAIAGLQAARDVSRLRELLFNVPQTDPATFIVVSLFSLAKFLSLPKMARFSLRHGMKSL
jgi:hypothetical protein